MKADKSSVDVRSTKYHYRKYYNIRILLKEYNVFLSAMRYVTQNECNYISICTPVTLFGLNNLQFNRKLGIIKSSQEPSGRQDVPHPLILPADVLTLYL